MKEIDLKILENMDAADLDRLSEQYDAVKGSDRERLFGLAEKRYRMRAEKETNTDSDEIVVSGTERYRRPKWRIFAAAASVLLLIVGIGAGGAVLLNRSGSVGSDHEETTISVDSTAGIAETTENTTAAAEPEPFLMAYDVPEALSGKNINEIEPLYEFAADFSDISNIADFSECIVYGKVTDISYKALGEEYSGKHAVSVVKLESPVCLYGDMELGDEAELMILGGYVSLRDKAGEIIYQTGGKYGEGSTMTDEEIDNTYYHEIVYSGDLPVIGMELAFFVNSDYYGITVIGGEYGVLSKVGDSFCQRVDGEYKRFSYDEIMELMKEAAERRDSLTQE